MLWNGFWYQQMSLFYPFCAEGGGLPNPFTSCQFTFACDAIWTMDNSILYHVLLLHKESFLGMNYFVVCDVCRAFQVLISSCTHFLGVNVFNLNVLKGVCQKYWFPQATKRSPLHYIISVCIKIPPNIYHVWAWQVLIFRGHLPTPLDTAQPIFG